MNGRRLAPLFGLALILGSLPGLGAVGAPQGIVPILADATYAGGTFTFRESLVVGPGATLTFRDAVVFLDAPAFCPTRGSAGYCQPSVMLDGGALRILDSVVDSHAWSAHDFESGWSVAGVGGVLEIRGSTLTHYKSLGTQLPGPAPSVVEESVFVEARGSLSFTRGAVAQVRGNAFEGVYMGVAFYDSESVLADNVFRNVGRDYGAGFFGRAVDVQATLVGEKQFRALTRVEGNLVENAHQGMLNLNGFPNLVRHNVFRGNAQALTLGISVGDDVQHSEAPLVEGNVFDANQDAVEVYTSGTYRDPDARLALTLSMHGNSFLATGCMDVTTERVDPHVVLAIDATRNWWGTPLGPQPRAPGCPGVADALVDPWLTEAP